MKMSKKVVAAMAVAAMAVTAIPVSLNSSDVKAAAFTAIAKYDFEAGTGMSSSGIGGTAPSVTSDSERGNVLQFADGSATQLMTHEKEPSLEEHSWRLEVGSPSSLKFTNPFRGRSMTGATIAMWVKVPTENAAGVSGGRAGDWVGAASGLVGFVDDKERGLVHPDCTEGGHSDQVYSGRTYFGIDAQPGAFFQQQHENDCHVIDTDASLGYNTGTWRYLAVAITNNSIKLYVDGKPVEYEEATPGKRFPSSSEYNNPGNQGMPYLLDFLANNMSYTFGGKAGTVTLTDKRSQQQVTYGKVESNVSAYVGFTGFSGTQAGVCIDDLVFFTKAYGAGDMAALYEAAKTPDGIDVAASSAGSGSAGGSSAGAGTGSGSSSSAKAVSAEAAAAIAASTRLVSAPEGVAIGTAIPILKGDAALGGTYDTIKGYLDGGIGTIIASNPEWSQLSMSNNIYVQEIPSIGRQLAEGEKAVLEMAVPEGFDTNMVWVLRINDDGSLTKCNILSVADGKLQFETDHLSKFAIVEMSLGKQLPKTGVVATSVFVLFGASAVAGGACLLKRKKEED